MLDITGLRKRYGATLALDGVDFGITAGVIHGLVGHNGAGKSTLIKCIAGAVQPDSGTMVLDGQPIRLASPADAARLGIRVIHQDAPLVPHFDAVEHCYLGRAYPRRLGFIDRAAMRRATAALAAEIAPDLPLDRPVAFLTAAQKQFVRLLCAIADPARLLVLDEPTAALPAEDAELFYRAIRALAKGGTAVVLVTHKLDEIVANCDDATVLADGKTVARFEGAGLTVPALIGAMGGSAAEPNAAPLADTAGGCVLSLRGISGTGLQVPVDLEVRPGEIVVLYGLVGSGRSELLAGIWGETPFSTGDMCLDGKPFRPRSPAEAVKAGISYVAADRHRTGLFRGADLVFNTTLPLLSRYRRLAICPSRMAGWNPPRSADRLKAWGWGSNLPASSPQPCPAATSKSSSFRVGRTGTPG